MGRSYARADHGPVPAKKFASSANWPSYKVKARVQKNAACTTFQAIERTPFGVQGCRTLVDVALKSAAIDGYYRTTIVTEGSVPEIA